MIHSALTFWQFVGHDMWHWKSGNGYQFWSGIGSDLGEVAIIGGVVALLRRHNCHQFRCWRLAWHPDPFTGHPLCRKHHPHDVRTLRTPIDKDEIGVTTSDGEW